MDTAGDRGSRFSSQSFETGKTQQSPPNVGAKPGEASAAGAAETVKAKAQEMASTVTAKAGEAWESTRQGVQEAASTVSHQAQDLWAQATSCMSRYPVATFLTGVGLGMLLAGLFGGSALLAEQQRSRRHFPSDVSL